MDARNEILQSNLIEADSRQTLGSRDRLDLEPDIFDSEEGSCEWLADQTHHNDTGGEGDEVVFVTSCFQPEEVVAIHLSV